MPIFFQHLGGNFLPTVARILPASEGGDPDNPEVVTGPQIDEKRHPALGDKAIYSTAKLYDAITGREATKQALENDPNFAKGTWGTPPAEALGFLLAHEFDVDFSCNSAAGSISFSEKKCSIYQTVTKATTDEDTEEDTSPGEFEDTTYHDVHGNYHALTDGSWDWDKRAKRDFRMADVADGDDDPPPVWKPRQPGEPTHSDEPPDHSPPDPPASPMGRLQRPAVIADVSKRTGDPILVPLTMEARLVKFEGDESLPSEIPIVIQTGYNLWPGYRSSTDCEVRMEGTATYHALYGMWSLPISVVATGRRVANDHAFDPTSVSITLLGDFPVDTNLLFAFYGYEPGAIEAFNGLLDATYTALEAAKKVEHYIGGSGRWTSAPPGQDASADKPKKINVTATTKPVKGSILPVFSEA